MYVFATVLLLGLAVAKLVDLVGGASDLARNGRLLLAFIVGVLGAWATDYSVFAGWDIAFRAAWVGPVLTGLVLGGVAAFWHEVMDLLASMARRVQDQATEIETRIPRAA